MDSSRFIGLLIGLVVLLIVIWFFFRLLNHA